jgi:hypothetical protein
MEMSFTDRVIMFVCKVVGATLGVVSWFLLQIVICALCS